MSKSGFLDSGGGGITREKIDFLAHQLAHARDGRGRWVYAVSDYARGTQAVFERSCVASPARYRNFLFPFTRRRERRLNYQFAASLATPPPSRNVEASD